MMRRRPQASIRRDSMRVVSAWIAFALLAPAAAAHTQNGSLGATASATDQYQIVCFDSGSGPSQSISLEILDSSPGALPQVSVHLQRGDDLVSASDTTAADAAPSPEIGLNGSDGAYRVLVTKTGAGTKFYSLTVHCTTGPDGSGSHAGTSLSVLQNQ